LEVPYRTGILISQAQKETPRWLHPARRWICDKSQWNKEKSQMEHSTDSILTQPLRVDGVAYLPTADNVPVWNPARRGRLPHGVVAMRKPREVQPSPPEPTPDNPIDAARRALATMQASMDYALAKIAEYEKGQRRTG
jgi:hypothetical protein